MKDKQIKEKAEKKIKDIMRSIAMEFWSGGYNFRGSLACSMQDTTNLEEMLKKHGL